MLYQFSRRFLWQQCTNKNVNNAEMVCLVGSQTEIYCGGLSLLRLICEQKT